MYLQCELPSLVRRLSVISGGGCIFVIWNHATHAFSMRASDPRAADLE